MAQHPNSLKNLKPFTADRQPGNQGRKPSKLKKFISDNGLGAADIRIACNYVLDMDESEIAQVASDKQAPFLLRAFAAAMISDIKNGKIDNVMTIINRSIGAPVQKTETDLSGSVDMNMKVEFVDAENANTKSV